MSVNGHGSIHLNNMKEKGRTWNDEESNQNKMAVFYLFPLLHFT
jgi:hypothetical protein